MLALGKFHLSEQTPVMKLCFNIVISHRRLLAEYNHSSPGFQQTQAPDLTWRRFQNQIRSSRFYWSVFKTLLIRTTKFFFRTNRLLIRTYELLIRTYEVLFRSNGLLIHSFRLLIRMYGWFIRAYGVLFRTHRLIFHTHWLLLRTYGWLIRTYG